MRALYSRVASIDEGEESEHCLIVELAIYESNSMFWVVLPCCAQTLGSIRSYAKHLRLDGVKDTIAIASGKGGVGKSTTAGKTLLSFFLFHL